MVPTANKDSHQLEAIDLESGDLDGTARVERQDSLFREVVRGDHHGGGGHSRQVRLLDLILSAYTCVPMCAGVFDVVHWILVCRIAGGGR